MKNFNGSGNYKNALNNSELVEVGVVDKSCWTGEWHHGDSGCIIGFVNKTDNIELVMASYKERVRAKFAADNQFAEYKKARAQMVRAEYNALVAKYGKEVLASLYKTSHPNGFDKFELVMRMHGIVALRKLNGDVIDFDIPINKNGGLAVKFI